MTDFNAKQFVTEKIEEIRKTVGDRKVLCALSGGVDSSVAAVLTSRAIGDGLYCIFVDHGLMREGEGDQVMEAYGSRLNLRIKRVDAEERFLARLAGITDPEQKRKIIGTEFIALFEEESRKALGAERAGLLGTEPKAGFLLQGTIFPDVVESGVTDTKESSAVDDAKSSAHQTAVIKSHHNVGGLPDHMDLELLEPLRTLYKDQVRAVGEELGIAPELVWRQPFPGPGLAIRCLGEVAAGKLDVLRKADAIVRFEIDAYNSSAEKPVWQYFAFLPDIKSVGMRDGARTYDHAIGIRAVTSVDAMTAEAARLPWDVLDKMSSRILAEVQGVNRVFYDLTSKPPGTIELE